MGMATKMKSIQCLLMILLLPLIHVESREKGWCEDTEDYFVTNCPIKRGDYNGCCLCTQYYYYGCDCCRDVVEEIGVGGDCTKWGEPTGDDEFCYMQKDASRPIFYGH